MSFYIDDDTPDSPSTKVKPYDRQLAIKIASEFDAMMKQVFRLLGKKFLTKGKVIKLGGAYHMTRKKYYTVRPSEFFYVMSFTPYTIAPGKCIILIDFDRKNFRLEFNDKIPKAQAVVDSIINLVDKNIGL